MYNKMLIRFGGGTYYLSNYASLKPSVMGAFSDGTNKCT